MKKILLIVPVAFLFACGGGEETVNEEPLNLEKYEDRLGYVMGSLNASSILQSTPQAAELDKEMLIEGFLMNLNSDDCSECDDVLLKFVGPYFQDFDTTYLKEGSKCVGRQNAFSFYSDMTRLGGVDYLNIDMVKEGFKHGVHGTDTLIDEMEKRDMITNFIKDLNSSAGERMMEDAKKIEGAEVFENGIVMQTLEKGNGGMPGATDDVQVEYILTNAFGDTVQSSYQMKAMTGNTEPVSLNLDGGVIQGWSYVLPKMNKGGKYRVYIPWNLAYGEQAKESLCFVIELLDYAPKGTWVKPQMPMGSPQ